MHNMYEVLLKLHTPDVQISPGNLKAAEAREVLGAFYEALHALDITSSALLIFNGVLITAAAFAAERVRPAAVPQTIANTVLRIWIVAVIVIGLIASALCLRVTHISYPFYGKVVAVTDSAGKVIVDFSKEFAKLDYEVALRTCLFQAAWWLSMIAVGVSVVVILYAVVENRYRPRVTTP
jgi:hypothetical protein